ncbi:hypothetical protein AC579_6271 [Pseudocercospora musae]|uniref:Cupin 2 conserved barrel domain-containing protein n=1 Tax=Pseudocercospora musae TaxID=113226 RepID=A0A139IPK6_9PEZI|nr:hypothetical protein AC579_6271 [Pseudocercospora musae]
MRKVSPSIDGTKELPDNHLPRLERYITTQNQDAAATFHELEPKLLCLGRLFRCERQLATGRRWLLARVRHESSNPIELQQRYRDVSTISREEARGGGTVLRYVNIALGNTSPMHRTVSPDYGVVLEGQVEAIMNSGESRLLNRGDIVVQRATNGA